MKTLFMLYLIIFKNYSIIRIRGKWCACDSAMEFDYSHYGYWGEGSTPQQAAINCYKKGR